MQNQFLAFEPTYAKKLLIICAITFFLTACASETADPTEIPTANPTDVSEVDADVTDDHSEDDDEHEHEDEHRELGVHEHGAAELTVAISGNEVAIDLQTPAFNILGFEYAPVSDEEVALLEESTAMLESGELLGINADAECVMVSAIVDVELADEEHEHDDEENDDDEEHNDDEEHEHDDEETHSDINVSYDLECQTPENIETLDASILFAQFPNFENLQVQWVSDTQQSAADLTPENPVLSFR